MNTISIFKKIFQTSEIGKWFQKEDNQLPLCLYAIQLERNINACYTINDIRNTEAWINKVQEQYPTNIENMRLIVSLRDKLIERLKDVTQMEKLISFTTAETDKQF